jgi:hypothetical protein
MPDHEFPDDSDDGVDVRFVQPYQATKTYVCPGCNQDIPPRTHHVVVVPRADPSERRHWHKSCWDRANRQRRR